MGHTFRFPAGEDGAVGITGDGCEHILRIQCIYCLLRVGKYGGAVGTNPGKLGSGPVKYGHEVVAYHVYAGLAQTLQGRDVVINVFVSVRGAYLDGIVNVHALNACKLQPRVFDFLLQCQNIFHFPYFTGFGAVKSGNDTGYTGNLSDLF